MEHSKYVVAVSGGVDSMVLLDMLAHSQILNASGSQIAKEGLIVAHFDHGIRTDSHLDEALVRAAAGQYGLPYEVERASLRANSSEADAREARYKFLRKCCSKYSAQLITAHHQDDVLETMLLNLIRGTGWRGLVSLDSTNQIWRPLLNTPKSELVDYAKQHGIQWREDSTNTNEAYLRNYIRRTLLPAMQARKPDVRKELAVIYKATKTLKTNIATELHNIINNLPSDSIPRYLFIMWPDAVGLEVIYTLLAKLDDNWHPTRLQLEKTLHFIKTGLNGKKLEVSKQLRVELQTSTLQFKKA